MSTIHSVVAGALLLALVATCSADYKSGVSACAPDEPRCPEGFECRGLRCYTIGSPGGEAGSSGTGMGNAAGGSSAGTAGSNPTPSAGGNSGSAGQGGGSPAPMAGSLGTAGRGGSSPPPTAGGSGMAGRGGSSPPATAGSSPTPPGTAGSGGGNPGAPPAAMCASLMTTTRCQACQVRLCCPEFLTTFGPNPDPAFAAYATCFRACMDNDCRDRCVTDNPAGIAVLRKLRDCSDMNCAEPCSTIGYSEHPGLEAEASAAPPS